MGCTIVAVAFLVIAILFLYMAARSKKANKPRAEKQFGIATVFCLLVSAVIYGPFLVSSDLAEGEYAAELLQVCPERSTKRLFVVLKFQSSRWECELIDPEVDPDQLMLKGRLLVEGKKYAFQFERSQQLYPTIKFRTLRELDMTR